MATSLAEADELVELARNGPALLVCAPHILLSPTFRAIHQVVRAGNVGRLLSARARYGWSGPWWGEWFYRPGGGSLFDLGVYNLTALCALFGPARRVAAMVGVAVPERVINGRSISVEADDDAHVMLDFGDSRFAAVTTGFTMQKYRVRAGNSDSPLTPSLISSARSVSSLSRHSRRRLATQRSACARARGARAGALMTRMPSDSKTSSKLCVNLLSRSRIR
jgi:hypothetical protein